VALCAVVVPLLVTLLVGSLPVSAGAVTVGQALTKPHAYAGGGTFAYGSAQVPATLSVPLNSVVVGMAPNPATSTTDQGYWLASADGGVYAMGNAGFYGSLGALRLAGPVVTIASTPDGRGYWMAALDGGVFAFGDAGFYGSMGGHPLNKPVVGMAPTPDGHGYWLVASDGGVFAFGDATFLGSMGGTPLVAPVVGMAALRHGTGYWLVAADGGVFAYGAPFYGSAGGAPLGDPVAGMASMPDDGGYYLVGTGGSVFSYGDAPFRGDLSGGLGGPHDVIPLSGIAVAPDGVGYWLLDPDGFNYSFSNPPDPVASPTAAAIVATAATQVNADPDTGYFCNPYGPCEAWCSLFATWVWQQAGVPVPSYAFTGYLYDWAQSNTGVLPPYAAPLPGDAVLYGTGPWSTATSVHVGLVAQVWPDGAIVTIEGDAGPAATGSLAVIVNGPFLPSQSESYNGVPIYAFARY
jgi:hypothetical protein